jgi:hypothetical protein
MADTKGPNKQDINEIKNALREIQKLYDTLGGQNPFAGVDSKKLANSADEVKRLKDSLQEAREAVSDMEGEAGDLFKSWKAIADEVKGNRKVLNDSKSTVSKINDLSQKIKDHQSKINTLSSKDLNNIKSKLEQHKSTLKVNKDFLQTSIDELTAKKRAGTATATELSQLKESEIIHKNITGGLEKDSGVLDQIISKTQQEAKFRKEIETSLGVTGGILKGMSKIPIIKDVVDTEKILKSANNEIELSGSGVKGLGAGFKEMGSQIKSGLLNPANLVLGFITQMASALKSVDSEAGDLAKSFNITYSEALNIERELGNMAATSGDVALTTKGLQETLVAVGNQLGTNAKLNEADLKTFTKLREQAGYTNEELMGIQQLSLVNNKSLEQNTKEILGGAKAYASRNKLIINEKQVLRDVSKMSASLKLTLGGSAEKMAESAVKARQFGLNLEQAEKMSSSLLDFESSIESELSAELLTGKDLNFERARGLALNGDTAAAAEEIAKQVGTSADFAKMNVIQQEAIAKAAGLTKDELAQSLMDREALAKLSGVEGANAQEKFNNLVKQVGLEEAKKQLGDEALANQYQQQSVQERFAQATEKLKELFIQIAEPILAIVSPLMDLVGSVLPLINTILQPIMWVFQTIADSVKTVFDLITSSTPALVTFGAVLAGILVTQQALAFQKKQGWLYDTYTFAMNQKNLIIEGAINAKKIIGNALEKKGLILGIAEAAMGAFKSMTAIPIVGPILGAAAAAAAVGLGYSLMKGDDIMSPGGPGSGYGKRTLLGPEGAIQLNNKDTVIAGTDLFGGSSKGDDVMSAPKSPTMTASKGALSVSNSTAPKKEVKQDPNAGTNARLDALISATGKVNSISTLKIQ